MRGTRVLRFVLAGVALVVLLSAGLVFVLQLTGPPLPAGATRLHITTAQPNLTLGCTAALLAPARVATDADELVLVNVESGETVRVVWPAGFGAWRLDGRAVLVNSWGAVVGREGDVLDSLGGGLGGDGDVFHICPLGIVIRD